jgi:hypothetical protein
MSHINIEFYRNGLTVRLEGNNFEEIQSDLNKAAKWAEDNKIEYTFESAGMQTQLDRR